MAGTVELHHERTQYPVGQGLFHSGVVRLGEATFLYVCDCGSTGRAPRDREIRGFLSDHQGKGAIDALFLSHIDNDHVAGLDALLAVMKPVDVFLRLLTPVARRPARAGCRRHRPRRLFHVTEVPASRLVEGANITKLATRYPGRGR